MKTFTCRELGGVCDEKISGETFMEVVNKGMGHMQSDEVHKEKMMSMSNSGETKEEWFARMQGEFNAKSADA